MIQQLLTIHKQRKVVVDKLFNLSITTFSNKFKRDRIRNPWDKITMSGNSENEVRLYDIVVTYYT